MSVSFRRRLHHHKLVMQLVPKVGMEMEMEEQTNTIDFISIEFEIGIEIETLIEIRYPGASHLNAF